jgi:hypothetical protein
MKHIWLLLSHSRTQRISAINLLLCLIPRHEMLFLQAVNAHAWENDMRLLVAEDDRA